MAEESKWNSRKYKSAWRLTFMMVAMFVMPELVTFILGLCGVGVELHLLTVGYFVPCLTLIWGGYFASNAATHFAYSRSSTQEHWEPTGARGGQPETTDAADLPEELQ